MFDIQLVNRLNRRTVVYGLLILWLVSINLWLYSYKRDSVYELGLYFTDEEYGPQQQEENPHIHYEVLRYSEFQDLSKKLGIKDKRTIDGHLTVYDRIIENHNFASILTNLDFKERCDLYFKNLYVKDRNWFLDPNIDLQLEHRYEFDFERFKANIMNTVKKTYADAVRLPYEEINFNDPKILEAIETSIKEEYESFWQRNLETEQKIVDYISHLRIFNKCYVTNDNIQQLDEVKSWLTKEVSKIPHSVFKEDPQEKLIKSSSFSSCLELESRIYRWISSSYPIYERWDGQVFFEPPDMRKFVDYQEVFEPTNPKYAKTTKNTIASDLTGGKSCFFNQFKNKLNGKGIVLSIKDSFVDDTVRLIHLLRALNNHYPIQIIYYDSVSDESKRKIANAARNRMMDLPSSFKKVALHFPPDYLNNRDGGLPKQEVWFVNAYNVIDSNYKDKFRGFANKFLAATFNSFSEYMLIDADTVLVEPPEHFFNLKNYKKKGAYFYKDRTAPEFRPEGDCKFFEKLTPSLLDNLMFDIPIVTQHTLGQEFFNGMGHWMESGLVMIDRNMHFNTLLTMIQLNFFRPVTVRLYGDKEIFWLGFAITGDENYHFNKYFAASIGTLTPKLDRLTSDGKPKKSEELCSAHPGHINGEDGKSLQWFNSGYQFCGKSDKVNFKQEVQQQSKLKFLKDAEKMKNYYENPIIIKNAIVPPFKNKLETWCENVIEEPKQGWHMEKGYCNSYLWCAYSEIGGTDSSGADTTQKGHIFEFDQKSTDLYAYYGDVWVGNE